MDYRSQILKLLVERGENKTICPSEVLPPTEKKNKKKMDEVRESARLLAEEDKIELTQKGDVVDLDSVKGPIRLRLKRLPKQE